MTGSTPEPGSADRAAVIPDFDDWVAARGSALMRFAYVLTGHQDQAEDAVQDALSRALPRWERIRQADDPDAYVRRMVVNAHTSWWRRFRRRESPAEDPVGRAAPTAGRDTDPGAATVDQLVLWEACRRLPTDQRVAVVLRYYEDLPYAEIAARTGVREGSARARVSRGLATLREELGGDDA